MLFGLASGCSENHRALPDVGPGSASDAGRASDAGLDGGTDAAAPCPPACSRCADGECVVEGRGLDDVQCPDDIPCRVHCVGGGNCRGRITCGSGPCVIECGGLGGGSQCEGPIDCSRSTACDIRCLGGSSCAGPITCGVGPCRVVCGGTGAGGQCRGGIDCRDACSCDVQCLGGSSCAPPASCPPGCGAPPGCTATRPACNRCE